MNKFSERDSVQSDAILSDNVDEDQQDQIQPSRIKAVSLKALYSNCEVDEGISIMNCNGNGTTKKTKFSKVKIGPAAQFIVKRC